MSKGLKSTLIASAICAAGGIAFYLLHVPLPWMLGSLTATAATVILGGRWVLPAALRGPARPVVGVLAGSAFTPEVPAAMLQWWDAILLVLAQSFVVTLLGFAFFRKFGAFDRETAFFAAVPGGVGEMALLGSSLGGNARGIVISHSMRMTFVVFSMPFIAQFVIGHPIGLVMSSSLDSGTPEAHDWAVLILCAVCGYGLARAIRFPAGLMILPMVLSAVAHGSGLTVASPPSWLVAIVQLVVGGILGARFAGIDWHEARRTFVAAAVWAGTLIAIAAASAVAGEWLTGRPFLAMLLALAPGGTVEMTILALSIGFEVAFVVTCQICRILIVLVGAPALRKLVSGGPVPLPPNRNA